MPSSVITGIALNGGTVNGPGTEQSEGTYFNALSQSDISSVINISESPKLLRAYNLGESDFVEVLMVAFPGAVGELSEPLVLNGKAAKLTAQNNALLLDLSGFYRLRLSAESPLTVTVVGHDSSLSYWSYGLAAFVQTAPES